MIFLRCRVVCPGRIIFVIKKANIDILAIDVNPGLPFFELPVPANAFELGSGKTFLMDSQFWLAEYINIVILEQWPSG